MLLCVPLVFNIQELSQLHTENIYIFRMILKVQGDLASV
jgi:hypothetical protein